MAWRKSPEALVALFARVVPADPRAESRQMFGYPACFVNGNMFAGLHQESLILRLGEKDRAELAARPGAKVFEPMPGRPMREYMVAPPDLVGDEASLRRWMGRALEHGASLPPKAGKAKAKAKPTPKSKSPPKRR